MASHNDLGEIGDDGVLRDIHGNVIQPGLDDTAKALLQEQLDGPKVRHTPSERDIFVANGGVLAEVPYVPEDSQQSGHIEDLKRDVASSSDTPKSSSKTTK